MTKKKRDEEESVKVGLRKEECALVMKENCWY